MSSVDQYMGIFLSEMEEQLENLNIEVLALEKSNNDAETINRLFRIAHTLKGSSATMGFEMISNLTHVMENVLDDVRNGKLQVSLKLINSLFSCLDQLQNWRDSLAQGTSELNHANKLIEELEALRSAQELSSSHVVQEFTFNKDILNQSRNYLNLGYWVGSIEIIVDDSAMKGVRAFMAFNKVREWAEVILTLPEIDTLTDEAFSGRLSLFVALQAEEDAEKLKEAIQNLSEMKEVSFTQWTEEVVNTTEVKLDEEVKTSKSVQKEQQSAMSSNTNESVTHSKAETNEYLRIEVGKLDILMNLLGELVIDKARLSQIEIELEKKYGRETTEALGDVNRHVSVVTSELQESLLKLRMSPMSLVYNRLPRVVRDLSHQLGKEVDFILEGEDTELDRTVIQNIFEPLIHLIRNSMDHGLETPPERLTKGKNEKGQVIVKSEQIGSEIIITVKDDGKGINPEVIRATAIEREFVTAQEAKLAKDADVLQWIFEPGFSTKKEVSEVSGRGVGMDVVRHKVEELQGRIEIESTVDVGTVMRITLPLTLAVIRALMINVNNQLYTIPLANVLETLRVPKSDIHKLGTSSVIVVRGRTIPLLNLLNWCGMDDQEDNQQYISVVLVSSGIRQMGLVVSGFVGEQEVVVKPFDKYLGRLRGFAGATLLGDGRVSLIYDIPALLNEVDIIKSAS